MERERRSTIERKTYETDIHVELLIDGKGKSAIDSGQAFFDHMLDQLARHSGMDIVLRAKGDLEIDCHHTLEDCGIALGQALAAALGDKRGLTRFAQALVPMDEALARCVLDISGRAYLHFEADLAAPTLGRFETETLREFMRAFAMNAGLTLHLEILYGENTHHKIEALFKALALALKAALSIDERRADQLPSTKGLL